MTEKTQDKQKICEKLERIEPILQQIKNCKNVYEKLYVINSQAVVEQFFKKKPFLLQFLESLLPEEMLAIISLVFLGVADYLFFPWRLDENGFHRSFRQLLDNLLDIEKFYDVIGGIIGYHIIMLKLIAEKDDSHEKIQFHVPPYFSIEDESVKLKEMILKGIEGLASAAMILPVGGAGDRLSLCDEITGEPLPAARLPFGGMTLLEGIVRDLQGLEYLYYKLYGKQLEIPIVMMTSKEKDNTNHIISICDKARWFGRHRHHFLFCSQPLTPVINDLGDWAVKGPFQPILKPGGHGVLWKLIEDRGIFNLLTKENIKYALIRQINNPLAGMDTTLLTLLGYGIHEQKAFGFASCERIVKSSEGMDLLVEKETAQGFDYAICNIEYTQFAKHGIHDIPKEDGSSYSVYPTNTNILFAEIKSLRDQISKDPIPGLLINMKHHFPTYDGYERPGGRLESTMQNIADCFVVSSKERVEKPQELNLLSFMTYNERKKTISVTKKSYGGYGSIQETPEGALYDQQKAYADLFERRCGFLMPPPQTEEEFIAEGPRVFISYHPALGPLWSIIEQKIQGGSIAAGSELFLNLVEAKINNFHLDGSLIIDASAAMGERNSQELLIYSELSGKIQLIDVKIENRGINRQAANNYWKRHIQRHEALKITLFGNAEFCAINTTFRGGLNLVVANGQRMIAEEIDGKINLKTEKLSAPSWWWKYRVEKDHSIIIES